MTDTPPVLTVHSASHPTPREVPCEALDDDTEALLRFFGSTGDDLTAGRMAELRAKRRQQAEYTFEALMAAFEGVDDGT